MNTEYLTRFEESLKEQLLNKLTGESVLGGTLLEVEELDEFWKAIAPEYMGDAMPLINDYPSVAIAWAAYFGIAIAAIWDGAWDDYKDRADIYNAMRDERGFDNMDEHIIEDILGMTLESPENIKLENTLRSMAQMAINTMRKEQVEAGTTNAFYIFASTAKLFFKFGVAIELKELGYHYEKLVVGGNEVVN